MKLATLQHGREWLAEFGFEARLYLHNNLDGLASGALVARRAAGEVSFWTPFQGPLDRRGPVVIVAQGVRPVDARGPILYVDHHPDPDPSGKATVVWDGGAESTSSLAWGLLGAPAELEWLSALGTFGNRVSTGTDPEALAALTGDQRRIATLCAAAARLRGGPLTAAFSMLRDSSSPADALSLPAARRLIAARQQLEEFTMQASRELPEIGPSAAIVEIDVPALVHPQIAAAWARRLAPLPVLVANLGWRTGVAYSVRCADPDVLAGWINGSATGQSDDPHALARYLPRLDGELSLVDYRGLVKALRGKPEPVTLRRAARLAPGQNQPSTERH